MNPKRYRLVNLASEKQDVHRLRPARPRLHRFRVAATLLPPAHERGVRCLELGGGRGEFAQVLTSKGYDVALVDASETNIRLAREAGYEAYERDLNEDLGLFESESFEGAVMLDVIEHVVRAEDLVEETFRVLKPGGFLLLSTPNFAWWFERAKIAAGKPPVAEGYHYRFFTRKTCKALLEQRGFVIAAEAYTTPAFGINFVRRKLFAETRLHVSVPAPTAAFLAETIFLRAEKALP
jgi:2-polyprenyl-3-methyl-5-hydroxy-6-metoxy-1,4-benzoquinol methylase